MGAVLSTPLIPLRGGGSAGPPWLAARMLAHTAPAWRCSPPTPST